MKNRERLLKTAIYDLLCAIQKNADCCPIYAATGRKGLCSRCNKYRINCAACLAAWLEEEERTCKK